MKKLLASLATVALVALPSFAQESGSASGSGRGSAGTLHREVQPGVQLVQGEALLQARPCKLV